jgi:hypothetical protein
MVLRTASTWIKERDSLKRVAEANEVFGGISTEVLS